VLVDAVRRSSHLPIIDEIRGVAVLAVICFHVLAITYTSQRRLPVLLWPFGAGKLGVDAFFVISGYVITVSWSARRATGSESGPMTFLLRRVRRLFPAYWASLVILVAVWHRSLLSSSAGLRTLLLHVSGQQFTTPNSSWVINSAYWTLTTQIHFYLLFPFLMVAMRWMRPRTVLLIVIGASVFVRVALHSPDQWPSDTILGRADQFAIGIAAAMAATRSSPLLRWLRSGGVRVAAIGGLAVVLFAYGSTWTGVSHAQHAWAETLVHPLFAGLLGLVFLRFSQGDPRPAILRRALRGLGTISYSVYLWHLPILDWLGRTGGPGLVGALVATGVVGSLSYVLFERSPRLLRHDFAHRRGTRIPEQRRDDAELGCDRRSPRASTSQRAITRTW
jgi:peptidoglycan/LPS O-acetylase OafA/YrhL